MNELLDVENFLEGGAKIALNLVPAKDYKFDVDLATMAVQKGLLSSLTLERVSDSIAKFAKLILAAGKAGWDVQLGHGEGPEEKWKKRCLLLVSCKAKVKGTTLPLDAQLLDQHFSAAFGKPPKDFPSIEQMELQVLSTPTLGVALSLMLSDFVKISTVLFRHIPIDGSTIQQISRLVKLAASRGYGFVVGYLDENNDDRRDKKMMFDSVFNRLCNTALTVDSFRGLLRFLNVDKLDITPFIGRGDLTFNAEGKLTPEKLAEWTQQLEAVKVVHLVNIGPCTVTGEAFHALALFVDTLINKGVSIYAGELQELCRVENDEDRAAVFNGVKLGPDASSLDDESLGAFLLRQRVYVPCCLYELLLFKDADDKIFPLHGSEPDEVAAEGVRFVKHGFVFSTAEAMEAYIQKTGTEREKCLHFEGPGGLLEIISSQDSEHKTIVLKECIFAKKSKDQLLELFRTASEYGWKVVLGAKSPYWEKERNVCLAFCKLGKKGDIITLKSTLTKWLRDDDIEVNVSLIAHLVIAIGSMGLTHPPLYSTTARHMQQLHGEKLGHVSTQDKAMLVQAPELEFCRAFDTKEKADDWIKNEWKKQKQPVSEAEMHDISKDCLRRLIEEVIEEVIEEKMGVLNVSASAAALPAPSLGSPKSEAEVAAAPSAAAPVSFGNSSATSFSIGNNVSGGRASIPAVTKTGENSRNGPEDGGGKSD
ncbi:MAG: hypothetical protein SGILL_008520 [Bacillariaceae sp.]